MARLRFSWLYEIDRRHEDTHLAATGRNNPDAHLVSTVSLYRLLHPLKGTPGDGRKPGPALTQTHSTGCAWSSRHGGACLGFHGGNEAFPGKDSLRSRKESGQSEALGPLALSSRLSTTSTCVGNTLSAARRSPWCRDHLFPLVTENTTSLSILS